MRPQDKTEQFIANVEINTDAGKDRRVLEDILQAHKAGRQMRVIQKHKFWRIIMKSRRVKLATVATIILAVVISAAILERMTAPAWALEQTIEALKCVKAVYIAGRMHSPWRGAEAEFEIWLRPHSNDPNISGDFRYREGDYHISVASERQNVTYVYERYDAPKVDVVYITEGLNRRGPVLPSGDLLAELRKRAENWKEQYRKDPETGRECVYVTFAGPAVNTARYWQIQIDLETKLPVRSAVWFNEDRKGKPHYEYLKMEYNPQIPEGFFEFEIPEGTQVVDCRKLRRQLEEDPNCGISVEQGDVEGACRKVARTYWQAVIAKDWKAVQKLRPLAIGEELSKLRAAYLQNEPVELVSIPKMGHLSDPGAIAEVTCAVRLKDGTIGHSLLNVDIQKTPSGPIGVIAGSIGPEFFNPE
jgi:hypothetical protein